MTEFAKTVINLGQKPNLIFVQIASYRDPELVPTIKDCIQKAKYPENLTFGICRQFSEKDGWDNLDEYRSDPRFTIMDVKWNESKGLGWARHHTQKLWKGEKYTMQLDSHHRFLQDWDQILLDMMVLTGSPKPILTSYALPYNPKTQELTQGGPYKMVGREFSAHGTIMFYPESIQEWATLTKPIPARFVSGHFYFTLGEHCTEYKYDPQIYFAGDEISLSIRSFTLGYDLFHPHRAVVWHEYTREGRAKHWDDFQDGNKNAGIVDKLWHEMDWESKQRLRHMLKEEDNRIDLGIYDLGTVRTHRDFEIYAGINFKLRKLHPNTVAGINPPVNEPDYDWTSQEHEYTYNLSIPATEPGFQFIHIGFEDKMGKILYRKDIHAYVPTLNVSFKSYDVPHKWVYWVYLSETGWGKRIDTVL